MTVIVPCMLGWTLQWYANVPGLLKVQAKLLPGSMYPESNECPSSDVTVCIGGSVPVSSFIHVILSPTWTDKELGL